MEAVARAGLMAIASTCAATEELLLLWKAGAYTPHQTVGDLVAILDAAGVVTASVVGHDFGANVAWNAAIMRPDRFAAVCGMSVQYRQPGGPRKDIVMIKEFSGRYHVHESNRSFADVVAALEAAVGSVENEAFDHELSEVRDPSDFEARMHAYESTSGFMRFLTIDHGAWLAAIGISGKARMYTIGNPLIARTMIKYDLGVGLNVPVRIAVYEEPSSGKVRVAYNLPSSLMSVLDDKDVSEAAQALDAKLIALAEKVSGAKA